MAKEDYFEGIVGQQDTKDLLSFKIDTYKQKGWIRPVLAVAPFGIGKTSFMRRFAEHLDKPMLETEGTSLTKVRSFVNQILLDVASKECTLFIDECHGMSKDVFNIWLKALDTTRTHNIVNFDGLDIPVDIEKTTFLFATTNRERCPQAFINRCEEVHFDAYTPEEASQIVRLYIPKEIKVEDSALKELGTISRGNARDARMLGETVGDFVGAKGLPHFDRNNLSDLMKLLGVYPQGVSREELRLLKIMNEYPAGVQLTTLMARMALDKESVIDMERYLRRTGLMEISKGLRNVTVQGKVYLRNLNNG